ncbi:hypothetical protein ABW20_dc0103555 [Dactylellina cionopaga]|nr:hypothetical protein ABW20_dc0103555 [Dactylellina cionopaga]
MPSFSQTVFFTVAALIAAASAGPIDVVPRDVTVCWGPNSKGTDRDASPTSQRCLNAWNEPAFTAPFALAPVGGASVDITTEAHQTFGPQHCCTSCKASQGCIGWQINNNCDCVLWKVSLNPDGTPTFNNFGVYGGPFQNQSGTFHRGPLFPVGPNLFGNTVTA